MKKLFLSILILSPTLNGCTTTQPAALAPQAATLLTLPFVPFIAFDRPGPYGNWWTKEPLPSEKPFLEKANSGPLSPKDSISPGVFVGWYGVIVSCKLLEAGKAELTLDHRFAEMNNIQFGIPDSHSIHTVSLFGDGLFKAKIGSPCKKEKLPGDLIRVYGKVETLGKEPTIVTEFTRYWPRMTYEVSPLKPVRIGGSEVPKRREKPYEAWPELTFEQETSTRQSVVDEKIVTGLRPLLSDPDAKIRANAGISLGEIPRSSSVLALEEALKNEKDEQIQKNFKFALQRAKQATGPFWKAEYSDPWWKNKSPQKPN
jgi:hypothetical protein